MKITQKVSYTKLDSLILIAVSDGSFPLDGDYSDEAAALSIATGRLMRRVVDARLRILKRQGKIEFGRKSKGDGYSGWRLVPRPAPSSS